MTPVVADRDQDCAICMVRSIPWNAGGVLSFMDCADAGRRGVGHGGARSDPLRPPLPRRLPEAVDRNQDGVSGVPAARARYR
eukprot:3796082-Rhodomonas_salina.2